jgi:penicillin-binding protein 2
MKKKVNLNRYEGLFLLVIILFSTILLRLFHLQVVSASEFKQLANNQAVRHLLEQSPRGEILDRNGVVLATNLQSYTIVFTETEESNKYFFNTFKRVFETLASCERINEKGFTEKEKLQDDFELKINPLRFEFRGEDESAKRFFELRFKKDRGYEEILRRRLYGDKKGRLSKSEKSRLEEELLKVTPQDIFNDLLIDYKIYKLLKLDPTSEKVLLKTNSKAEIASLLLEQYSPEELRKFILVKDAIKMQSFSGYRPVTIASNIDRSTAFIFEQLKHTLPGIDVTLQPVRYYPHRELGACFLGYIARINSDRREKYEERGYDINSDYIGAAGLESALEDRLKGSKGSTTVRVNKYGRKTEELFKLDCYPGQNIMLTIDKKLQSVTERALKDVMMDLQVNHTHGKDPVDTGNATRGAAVVLNVNTGAVLAMASNPSFDPNIFAVPGRLTPELYRQYFAPDLTAFGKQYIKKRKLDNSMVTVDKLFPIDTSIKGGKIRKDYYDIYPKPFYNYATCALVPPGSTFKAMTAIAGMEEKVINQYTRITDAHVFDEHGDDTKAYGGACWIWNEYRGSHGSIDLKTALEVSCNYYFFEVGYRLYKCGGLDNLAKYAWKFGLGLDPSSKSRPSTGIEIYENFGQVYNLQSRKNIGAINAIDGIERILRSGIYYPGSGGKVTYRPLNVCDNAEDTTSLRDAKRLLKETLRNNIKSDSTYNRMNIQYISLRKDLTKLLGNVVAALPEEQKRSYRKEDISSMAEAVSIYVTYDVKTTVATPGNIYDASIGQGINVFTPLQLANFIATFVNGGKRHKIHLVDKILSPDGQVVEQIKPEIMEKINLSPMTIATVKDGMRKVTGENGTAAKAFINFPIQTGGKTGSATYRSDQERIGRTSYGIYLGFAPYDNPEIAVCVVIFDGGHGGYVAPVARAIYEEYFKETLKQNYKNFRPMFNYTLD